MKRQPSSSGTWRAAVVLLLVAACGREEENGAEGAPPSATVLARERAAARFERFDFVAAREELATIVEPKDAAAEDLLRAAAVEFALHEPQRAAELLDRAETRGTRSPTLDFLRGEIALERGDLETAVRHLRAAAAAAPADLAARLALASALQDEGQFEEAEPLYRSIVEIGIENGETWYLAALYRLQQMLRGLGREQEAAPLTKRWEELAQAGVQVPSEAVLRLGRLGWVEPPAPQGSTTTPAASALRFEERALDLPPLAGALELAAHDLDGDLRMDVLARSAAGVAVALRTEHGWDVRKIVGGAPSLARAFDLDNDADLDLAVFGPEGAAFFLRGEADWEPAQIRHPALPSPPADAQAVDFDHEGDLDLLLVGSFGALLWRNDGAWVEGGAFSDATEEALLPRTPGFRWCTTEDFDGDGDVDLLLGGPEGVHLADNQRSGRFADRSGAFGSGLSTSERPIVADFDGDARPDVWIRGRPAERWKQTQEGSFERVETRTEVPSHAGAIDIDLDGALDLAWPGAALLAAGSPQETLVACTGWPAMEPSAPLCFADFDDDLTPDALRATDAGAALLRGNGAIGNALRVRLLGAKDNKRAVGAVIEVRAGGIYRRIYYRGDPEVVGVGPNERADVFRVHWPNGLVQTALDRDLADQTGDFALDEAIGNFAQEQGLIGSCPFLYTWNGTSFEFVTDVLGITPLGLPLAPGRMVPFDHDEYVLVRGHQLVPRADRLELAITEELREVTYLDRVRLDVVDHPVGTEIHPNERFTFPPFPEPHIHALRAPLAPVRATGSDGRAWTRELATADGAHAVPFEREAPQFQGLTRPWFLELEFDRQAVAQAKRLRLVLTGWFYWTDASVNVAAARHPGVDFVPPILSVPDGRGGWRELGPPIGFPAGKTKTMVVEIEARELASDPRLRIACTLELYWDRIALAVDEEDAERRTSSLEPVSARLWERGFSARVVDGRAESPERFEWARLAAEPRWDQHPGSYTRFGECLELVTEIDDRYVILGAGDALSIAFDARTLPPLLAGFERDYVLFLDGWAKDRDPNTIEALEVEPLPFHGMSAYPYPAEERFPADELHLRWRREWNTRPARRWIEPLSLVRRAELSSPVSAMR